MLKHFLTTIQAAILIVLTLGGSQTLYAKAFQTFSNARLVQLNDGDSFHIDIGKEVIHIRLYFVDCPESSVGSPSDARRIREQTRYFGLTNAKDTLQFGKEASQFTQEALSTSFTVYTAFANAMGRSKKRRVYGLIETEKGEDLGSLLVKNGLCRPRGVGRKTPKGISRDEMFEKLQDLQDVAMLKKIGVWSKSDPEKIAQLREAQRNEDKELKNLKAELNNEAAPQNKIDLNTATTQQLQSIKGIGAVFAGRIIEARPYKNIEELLKVKGIGAKSMIKIRPYIVVGNQSY